MTYLMLVPGLVALLVAGLAFWQRRAPWTAVADIAVAFTMAVSGVLLLLEVRQHGPVRALGGLLRVDELSAYMLVVVGLVAITALWGGLAEKSSRAHTDGWLTALVALFLLAMGLSLCADNLGIAWVGVEATTITTAFLVSYRGGKRAIEAAWKYVVLGSVGLAFAFLGLVLLYAATAHQGTATLQWTSLVLRAGSLHPGLVKLGVGLAVFGFATKAGLAPLHAWLPDAHSQAPAPVSGLMSGVLLSVAFYAILRIQAIAVPAGCGGFVRALLLGGGLLSLAVAGVMTLTQRDMKRLLAYSSIEHMGIIALGAATGSVLGLSALLVHVLGHGLAKASMFATSGRIMHEVGSTAIADVRGLLTRRPDLAVPFLAGGAALLGFPPFVLLLTEVGIMVALVQAGWAWAAGIALALLLLSFAGISRQLLAMCLGPGEASEHRRRLSLPLLAALALCAVLTLAAWPLRDVLGQAVMALSATGALR